jgi:hypothetical protein
VVAVREHFVLAGTRPLPTFCAPDGSASCLIRARPAVLAVQISPFPPASSDHAFDWRARAHRS